MYSNVKDFLSAHGIKHKKPAGSRVPTAKSLVQTTTPWVVSENYTVYQPGYVVYHATTGKSVVFPLSALADGYKYVFQGSADGIAKSACIPPEEMDLTTAVMLYGEDAAELNIMNRKGDRMGYHVSLDEHQWDAALAEAAHRAESPEDCIIKRELIQEHLDVLTDRQRQVILLRFQGKTQMEIADELNISQQSVQGTIASAKQKWQSTLTM